MLSGSAYTQMIKEVDDMVNYNNFDIEAIMNMPPFEFRIYRRHYIDKQNKAAQNRGG